MKQTEPETAQQVRIRQQAASHQPKGWNNPAKEHVISMPQEHAVVYKEAAETGKVHLKYVTKKGCRMNLPASGEFYNIKYKPINREMPGTLSPVRYKGVDALPVVEILKGTAVVGEMHFEKNKFRVSNQRTLLADKQQFIIS
jgi:hypothetical protein